MSHNSDSYQLPTSSSSPTTSNQNTKRLPSSSSTIQNDFSSSQSHTSPIVNDVCAGSQNGVRNASTTIKMHNIISPNGNHSNEKYAFTLEFSPPVSKTKKYFNRNSKPQLFQFNMEDNDQEDLHSPFELDVPLCENKRQNDFLIDRMLKDESNLNYSSQQRSPNQSSYTNILNQPSPIHTPSSDHHDTDALSDAGTYIIEDELDIARDDEPEPDIEQSTQENQIEQQNTSTSFKRYTKTKRTRQGTFDIHALASPSSSTATTAQTVNRPVVDLNIPTHDITSPSSSTSSANLSSSSSSLLSLPTESDNSTRKEPEGASHYLPDDNTSSSRLIYARQRPNSLSQQQRSITPPQSQLKPAECFVISPTFETKTFPNTTNSAPRRKLDTQRKPKTSTVVPTKDINSVPSNRTSPSTSPHSIRSNQNDTERYSFRLQQQQQPRQQESKPSSSLTQKSSLSTSEYIPSSNRTTTTTTTTATRPHTIMPDQTYSSPFQRNSTIRQTMPASTQYSRPMSSSTTATTNKYIDDNEEVVSSHPSLTKVYMNKSFALRRQRSHLVPSTTTTAATKPVPTQQPAQSLVKAASTRQPMKATTSIPSTALTSSTSSGQTNRAVELRRARAQAKIEELANRTRHQLQKTEHHNDIMSASWHSNASSSSRKDLSTTKSTPRSNQLSSQKQDLLKTRTISTSYHRSSSASPNPLGESTGKTSTYHRRPMTSSVTEESQYRRMNGSTYSEGDRCDSLRDDGQRLAIKLIQLSSGILAKLKPNNTVNDTDSNALELEQLVDQLQTINRTLSTIDASLTGLTSDETVL